MFYFSSHVQNFIIVNSSILWKASKRASGRWKECGWGEQSKWRELGRGWARGGGRLTPSSCSLFFALAHFRFFRVPFLEKERKTSATQVDCKTVVLSFLFERRRKPNLRVQSAHASHTPAFVPVCTLRVARVRKKYMYDCFVVYYASYTVHMLLQTEV